MGMKAANNEKNNQLHNKRLLLTFLRASLRASLLVLCLFCACNKQQESDSKETSAAEEEQWSFSEDTAGNWAMADNTPASSEIDSKYLLFRQDSMFFVSKEEKEYLFHIRDCFVGSPTRASEKNAVLQYPAAGDIDICTLLGISFDASGKDELWGLWKISTRTEATANTNTESPESEEYGHYELVCYDFSGESLEILRLDDRVQLNDAAFRISVASAGDYRYLLSPTDNTLTILTAKGKLEDMLEVADTSEILMLDENYYLAESSAFSQQTTLSPLSDGKLSEIQYEIPISTNRFGTGADGTLYLSTADLLYKCDLENQTLDLILKWSDSGLQFPEIFSILGVTKDTISVERYVIGNSQHILHTLKPSDKVDQRIEVVLFTHADDWHVNDFVYGFNQTNDTYRVVIEDCGMETLSYEEFALRLQLLVTSSDPPDLIDIRNFDNWEEFARNGAFTDLKPFIDAGSPIKESNYLPGIWASGSVDGQQIYIPSTIIYPCMWFGQERYVGSDMGWTLEEMLTLCKEHEDIPMFNHYLSSYWLEQFLTFGLDEFVDFSTGTCDFENQLFYDVLECSAKADLWEKDLESWSDGWTVFRDVLNEDVLLDSFCLSQIEDYLAYRSAIPVGDGESVQLAIKGYPTKHGLPAALGNRHSDGECYAILGNSTNKDGAWAFIEYVIEESWKSTNPYAGRSATENSAKTEQIQKRFLHKNPNVIFGSYEDAGLDMDNLPGPTQEDFDNVMLTMENMRYLTSRDEIILRMIEEEAQAYFSGQKSKEEVTDIIQSRVGLYVAEHHKG